MRDEECIIGTKVYPPGYETCGEDLCFVCQDGVWREKREDKSHDKP